MTADGLRKSGTGWLKFNAVGGIGIAVQLAALKEGLHLDYLLATALAVQAAVVHNFLWHARFTWVDRSTENGLVRFLEFNLTAGAFSIAGNLLIMRVVVSMEVNYLVANAISIAACSLANFVVSDLFVFRDGQCGPIAR